MTGSLDLSDDRTGGDESSFELTSETVLPYLVRRGVLPPGARASVSELAGGVSATVLAVHAPEISVVVKQALTRLKVDDDWRAKQERTEYEAAAMRLCYRLTPGRVPRVLDSDPSSHVMVMERLPEDARNWQLEVSMGRAHVDVGGWAGETLGIWHAQTEGDPAVAESFDDLEPFEQQRLSPFYETVVERLPEVATDVVPRVEELRHRRCLVDGDYAMKNILVGQDRNWALDLEVAHYGNPIFDLGFFLSFVVLSAIRWPRVAAEMRALAQAFAHGYASVAGDDYAGDPADVTAHTGCLMLARTDGKSPAQFLDEDARVRARAVGIALLRTPERGLWQWM